MKCTDVLSRLEEFYDGELKGWVAGRIESHLRVCPACSLALQSLRAEDGIYRKYAEDVEESLQLNPAIWQRVRERIAGLQAPRAGMGDRLRALLGQLIPLSPLARQVSVVAMVAAVSVAVTLVAVRFYDQGARRSTVQDLAQTPADGRQGQPRNLESALHSVERAEQEYLKAIDILNEIVEKEKPSLDPGFLAEFQKSLNAVDQNIAATRAAYYARRADPDLAHFMLAAYSRKVELLQQIVS